MKIRTAALALTLSAGAALGQTGLIVGVDDTTVPFYIYNDSGQWEELLVGYEAWGMAVDPASCTLYFNSGSTLYRLGREETVPTEIGTITVDGSTSSFVSLAFYNGVLYGTKNIATEAVYSIDTSNAVATILYAYPSGDFDFGGIDIDPDTGIMYGTNDDSTPQRGVFSIDFVGQSTTFIADYPAGETDIDGLAVGGGKLYLVVDQAGDIYPYNLSTNSYETPFANPFTTSEVFSGGAWGPCFLGGGGCPACAADYDQSGGVDGDDITAFFNDWQAGAPCGDVDGSGGVDGDDIPFFFDRWQAGGCN